MSENADPNHRVVDVLAFLAANPLEEFSLAELSRELGLSKGTSHRLMTALAERQFVSRHPRRKTYSLGIALIAIGQAALEKHPGIAIARREMLRISTDLLVPCGITTVVGDQFLLLGREGAPQSQDGLVLVGERRMLVPPIGICHMAWRSDADIAAYLDRGAAYMSAPMRQHMLRAFPEIRRRGYAMAANGPGMRWFSDATILPIEPACDATAAAQLQHRIDEIAPAEYQMLDLAEAGAAGVNYISAPIFSPEGEVRLELVLSGLPAGLGAGEIERYANRLCVAAEIVTNETRGRAPRGE